MIDNLLGRPDLVRQSAKPRGAEGQVARFGAGRPTAPADESYRLYTEIRSVGSIGETTP